MNTSVENTTAAQDISVTRDMAEEWAPWFKAMSDPTRILLLNLLSRERRPMTVGEITERLDVGQSTISHHLAKLADVRFVLANHVGTSSLWEVNHQCLACFPSAAEMIMGHIPDEFTQQMECD